MIRAHGSATTVVLLMWSLCFVRAPRAESTSPAAIRGKWGLGAGLGNGATELTLIRGHSERTAWLISARVDYSRNAAESELIAVPLAIPPRATGVARLSRSGPG